MIKIDSCVVSHLLCNGKMSYDRRLTSTRCMWFVHVAMMELTRSISKLGGSV